MELYAPITNAIEKGVEQKILKDVNRKLITSFCFYPFAMLANPRHCGSALTEQDMEVMFDMAWDAVRY